MNTPRLLLKAILSQVATLLFLTPASFGDGFEASLLNAQTTSRFGNILDYDGDGDLDVALPFDQGVSGANGGFALLRNDGSGTLTRADQSGFSGGVAREIKFADFDQDGRIDSAVPYFFDDKLRLYRNVSAETVAPLGEWDGSRCIAIGDLNGDEFPDIISAGASGTKVLRNLQDGTFDEVSTSLPIGNDSCTIDSADLDGDGDLDLLFYPRTAPSNAMFVARLIRNDGALNFVDLGTLDNDRAFLRVRLADFDGDGLVDIGGYDFEAQFLVYRNLGGGNFAISNSSTIVTGNPTGAGDFFVGKIRAEESFLSVAIAINDLFPTSLKVYSGSLDGGFREIHRLTQDPSLPTGQVPKLLNGFGDLTGDGFGDLVGLRMVGSSLETLLYTGNRFSITGLVSRYGTGLPGASIAVTGTANRTALTGSNGTFNIASLGRGVYNVSAQQAPLTFSPSSASVTISELDATITFAAIENLSISGRVLRTDGGGESQIGLSLTGDTQKSATTSSDGSYSFTSLTPGAYTVTLLDPTFLFAGGTRTQTVSLNDVSRNDADFTVRPVSVTINGSDLFTKSLDVILTLAAPAGTDEVRISNDGSFLKFTGVIPPVGTSVFEVPWTLEDIGAKEQTRIVYVQFRGTGLNVQRQDDIILDNTKPKITRATVRNGKGGASEVPRGAAKRKKLILRISATDTFSGVKSIRISNSIPSGWIEIANPGQSSGLTSVTADVPFQTSASSVTVIARDASGNRSKPKRVPTCTGRGCSRGDKRGK